MRLIRLLLLVLFVPTAFAQTPAAKTEPAKSKTAAPAKSTAELQKSIRAHMEYLASDALRGRGSATEDELTAAKYIAEKFKEYKIQPAGDADASGKKGYIQNVPLTRTKFSEMPVLSLGDAKFTHGKEMALLRTISPKFSGPLQKWKVGDPVQKGAAVYVHLREGAGDPAVRTQIMEPLTSGAGLLIIADAAQIRQRFAAASKQMPELPMRVGGQKNDDIADFGNALVLSADASKIFDAAADGATVSFAGTAGLAEEGATRNVIGVLPGSDPALAKEVILLTAHMDHLGVRENAPGDDKIYNGADDDASGTVAVLEMARKLAAGKRLRRTVYFVTFGSEERGGWGANYFLQHPPVPITEIAANLEFEMIGRGDSAVPADTLWLTGYERSNLGPELAKQGAKIVADPHPDERFFERSDNIALARKGVIAQTVSSFGLHKDYHQASDDFAHIDFDHMTRSIESMFAPVTWLANSTFKPEWVPGKKP
ncbi:MAG TPA: M20/M25/M40 family metallo-hydrolase [Terriglobales bacterium]|nr:M20/M25/M40 family metallo-hydrolase [Terriglobales bacterium]